MAYPDFSELSFGYCFLRELETRHTHGGRFPKAPDFISQYDEGTKGYDVEVAMDGAIPLFIQLKRSEVMTRSNAGEFGTPWFSAKPVYRMNLHRSRQYAQHRALQTLVATGKAVVYATSQVEDPTALSTHSAAGTIIAEASAIFSPGEIQLPDLTAHHHVSFYAGASWAAVFSAQGRQFDRRFPAGQNWLSQLLEKPRSRAENQQAMREVVDHFRREGELADPERLSLGPASEPEDRSDSGFERLEAVERLVRVAQDRPAVQAAIYAYFLLDAQLTFVKPAKG